MCSSNLACRLYVLTAAALCGSGSGCILYRNPNKGGPGRSAWSLCAWAATAQQRAPVASSTRMQPTDQMSQGKLQPRPRMTSGALRTPSYCASPPSCLFAKICHASFMLQLSTLLALFEDAQLRPNSSQADVLNGRLQVNKALVLCRRAAIEEMRSAPVVAGGHYGGVVLVVEGGAAKVNDLDVAAPRYQPLPPAVFAAAMQTRRSTSLHGGLFAGWGNPILS